MPLQRKQLALAIEPSSVTAECSIAADNPVARDQHGDVIVTIRCSDRPNGFGLTDRRRYLGVAPRLAKRNLAELAPNHFLESRPRYVDRQLRRRRGTLHRDQRALHQLAQSAVVLDDRRIGKAPYERSFAIVER